MHHTTPCCSGFRVVALGSLAEVRKSWQAFYQAQGCNSLDPSCAAHSFPRSFGTGFVSLLAVDPLWITAQIENRAGAQEKDPWRRSQYLCLFPQARPQELGHLALHTWWAANSCLLLPTLTRQFWNSSEALGPPQSPAPLSWLSPARTSHVLSPGSRPGCRQHCGGGPGTLAPGHSGPWRERAEAGEVCSGPGGQSFPEHIFFTSTINYPEEGGKTKQNTPKKQTNKNNHCFCFFFFLMCS